MTITGHQSPLDYVTGARARMRLSCRALRRVRWAGRAAWPCCRALVLLPYSAAAPSPGRLLEYAAIPTRRPDLDADGARNQCTVGRRSIWKTADLSTTLANWKKSKIKRSLNNRNFLATDYGPASSGNQPWSSLHTSTDYGHPMKA